MNWTIQQDSVVRQHIDGVAANMLGVSKDAVRNRRKRIEEADARLQSAQALSSEEPLFEIPAAPAGSFVGINTIFWDLESTALSAIMGRVLCCSFADSFGQVKTFRYEDYPGKSLIDDGPLVVAIRDELEKANHWVTWNGKLFDVPLLNARLLKAGQRPVRSDLLHTDLMYYSRGQFVRIGSSKLVNVSKFINSPNVKSDLSWETWQLAATGDKESMNYIVEHCEADVLVTRDVFHVLKVHVRNIHR